MLIKSHIDLKFHLKKLINGSNSHIKSKLPPDQPVEK